MPSSKDVALTKVTALIFEIRGHRVILDADLAQLYGVETKRLNEQVRRNADRFPDDFAFRLTREDIASLKSQFATSNPQDPDDQRVVVNWSQDATGSGRGGKHKMPLVFTEHGALMAANVLRSPKAVEMSVFVVRAFVKMREMLTGRADLARKLADLEKKLTQRLDLQERVISDIIQQIMLLLNPPPEPEPPRKQIGFGVCESRAKYRVRKKGSRHAK